VQHCSSQLCALESEKNINYLCIVSRHFRNPVFITNSKDTPADLIDFVSSPSTKNVIQKVYLNEISADRYTNINSVPHRAIFEPIISDDDTVSAVALALYPLKHDLDKIATILNCHINLQEPQGKTLYSTTVNYPDPIQQKISVYLNQPDNGSLYARLHFRY